MVTQSVAQIRTDIESTKGQISQTFTELEERFQEMKDWRSVVQHYPFQSILISVGVGLLASGLFNKSLLYSSRQFFPRIAMGVITGILVKGAQQKLLGEPRSLVLKRSGRYP
jgi:hypothetical protein